MHKVRRYSLRRLLVRLGQGRPARAVDGYEHVELAVFGTDLRDVDVEVADRAGFGARTLRLVTVDVGWSDDAMTLRNAVRAGSRQVRDGGLERIRLVVERRQGVAPGGHDHGLVLGTQDGGTGLPGTSVLARRDRRCHTVVGLTP